MPTSFVRLRQVPWLLAGFAACQASPPPPLAAGAIVRVPFEVDLGGWTTAADTAVTLREMPGLGHTLGLAASLVDDTGRAPDPAIFAAVAEWLRSLR